MEMGGGGEEGCESQQTTYAVWKYFIWPQVESCKILPFPLHIKILLIQNCVQATDQNKTIFYTPVISVRVLMTAKSSKLYLSVHALSEIGILMNASHMMNN